MKLYEGCLVELRASETRALFIGIQPHNSVIDKNVIQEIHISEIDWTHKLNPSHLVPCDLEIADTLHLLVAHPLELSLGWVVVK